MLMVVHVHQSMDERLSVIVHQDGVVHSVLIQLINAKVNPVIMVAHVNLVQDGFVVCVPKDFRDPIAG